MSGDERDWLIRAQQGDDEAFANLVGAYQSRVHNLCYRMLGDPYAAEDAAQETFLRAYRAIRRYDLDRPFVTWLLTIASRYCIDQLRRRRLQTRPFDEYLGEILPADTPGPEGTLTRREEEQRMQAALDELKPTDRAAVVLHYWHQLSYEEIAGTLSLTVSAVKSRLHRARKALALAWQAQESAGSMAKRTAVPEANRYESPAY